MKHLIGRQPILDSQRRVKAYELLFRGSAANNHASIAEGEGTNASLSVLGSSLFHFGLDELVGRGRGFINFTEELLLERFSEIVPSDRIVVEILETITLKQELIDACHQLRKGGYRFALDDVVNPKRIESVRELISYVKVDWAQTTQTSRKAIAESVRDDPHITLLAEKIETEKDFRQAHQLGYQLFQGYFFAKPTVLSTETPTGATMTHLELMKETSRADIDVDQATLLIEREPNIAYTLLKYLNTAAFQQQQPVKSIRHALLLLGQRHLRRWLITILVTYGQSDNEALVLQAVERGRFCEMCADLFELGTQGEELYLTGMLSLSERMLAKPASEIVELLSLSDDIAAALLGREGPFHPVLQLCWALEQGDTETLDKISQTYGIAPEALESRYRDAATWARQLI